MFRVGDAQDFPATSNCHCLDSSLKIHYETPYLNLRSSYTESTGSRQITEVNDEPVLC